MIGWGAYAPQRIVTNEELAKMVDTSHEWIVQRSGIHTRRIAAPEETTSTMCLGAARQALARAKLDANALDLIIIATSTPDQHSPPVSSVVQHALGAAKTPGFVLVNGCTGFVSALITAYQFIASGACRTILVIGAELLSRFVNWQDRSTCVLFGDAAGAVILQASETPGGLLGFNMGSDGGLGQHIVMPAGGSAMPASAQTIADGSHYIYMNGREVFKFATRVIGRTSTQALDMAGLTLDQIDWLIPHQANLRIIDAAAEQMKLPRQRFIVNIDRYANTSAASIPLALNEALEDGRVRPGQRLLLAAFGAGLSWASAVLQV
jgi:3-oxoacyl-[acyl-carrier-protein] synthase-3